MKAVKDQITELMDEAEELSTVKEDVFGAKADLNIQAVGVLLETLKESTDNLSEIAANKDYYDKDLTKTLKETVSQLITAFSKIKPPTVNVSPNISMDLKPIESIAKDISSQNKSLIDALNKIGTNGNNELQKAILTMIAKQNTFLDQTLNQNILADKFSELIEVLKEQRPVIEKLDIIRDDWGIRSMKPIYKK